MKKYTIEIKFALTLTGLTLFWTTLEKFLGFHDDKIAVHPLISMFILIPIVAIHYVCLIQKRQRIYGGFMTYKQGFLTAARFTLFCAVLSPLSQILISTYISPAYFHNAIAYATDHQLMSLAEAQDHFNLANYIVQSMLGSLVFGLLIGSIMAAVCQKKKTAN